jgi:hypothetical protein
LLGLLGYPIILEPALPLSQQGTFWAAGYLVLAALILACASFVLRNETSRAATTPEPAEAGTTNQSIGPATRIRWLLLSAVPSSLLLGVTTFLAMDVASFPLLWVIPLSLYLLTLIFAFAGIPDFLHRAMVLAFPVALLMELPAISMGGILLPFAVHLGVFWMAGLICHGELARARPLAQHLTEFYFWVAAGGVLGGIFNALVAPLLFNWVAEYPIALTLVCMLLPRSRKLANDGWNRCLDLLLPLTLLGVTLGMNRLFMALASDRDSDLAAWASLMGLKPPIVATALACSIPAMVCVAFIRRPIRFGLGVGVLMLAANLAFDRQMHIIYRERSFFGVLFVSRDSDRPFHRLIHGKILHGIQNVESTGRPEPLTYYHVTGPIGHVFTDWVRPLNKRRVAVIGLGAGTLACYGESGQHFTFYEIDPGIVRLANDSKYFTYLLQCRAKWDVLVGDARLRMAEAPNHDYDLIVLDAFSSDAVPVHLLTREALRVYLAKLAPGGVIAMHVSNIYFNLEGVVGNLAADVGLTGYAQFDRDETPPGKSQSHWVVLARKTRDLGTLPKDPRWRPLAARPDLPLWTDDYSNVLPVMSW